MIWCTSLRSPNHRRLPNGDRSERRTNTPSSWWARRSSFRMSPARPVHRRPGQWSGPCLKALSMWELEVPIVRKACSLTAVTIGNYGPVVELQIGRASNTFPRVYFPWPSIADRMPPTYAPSHWSQNVLQKVDPLIPTTYGTLML